MLSLEVKGGAQYRKCRLERQENLSFPHYNPLRRNEFWVLSTSQCTKDGQSEAKCIISGCGSTGCGYPKSTQSWYKPFQLETPLQQSTDIDFIDPVRPASVAGPSNFAWSPEQRKPNRVIPGLLVVTHRGEDGFYLSIFGNGDW